ncbi:hypothetical protein NE865_00058 [Phthorimaea operculella]|nr:hypothetical protein NE865_00058 [Phthorimaea operculella]
MVNCKACKVFASPTSADVVKCKGPCESWYHKKCIKNLRRFKRREICDDCLQETLKKSPKIKKPEKVEKVTVDLNTATVETVLGQVNQRLEVLFSIQETLSDLADTVDFYADQYQEMLEFKKKAERKMTALEQKSKHLETVNKALEERLLYLEQKDRERNVKIIGLNEIENKSTEETVKVFAEKMQLNYEEVEEIKTVGPKTVGRARPIVVTLRSRRARESWLKQKRTRLTNKDLSNKGNNDHIYINENLSHHMRHLFKATRTALKGKFKYIWIQNSKILVRKNDNERKIICIYNESKIEELLQAEKQSNGVRERDADSETEKQSADSEK